MKSSLIGKTAIITGAGSGIGQSVSRTLWKHGCSLVLIGRRLHKLQETYNLCLAEGTDTPESAHIEAVDVSDLDSVRILSERDICKQVDILINNAGMHGGFSLITESDPLQGSKVLHTNVIGPYYMARFFTPGMKKRGWGRIINVSSAAAFSEPTSANSVYSLSKIALNRFTRQLAEELDGTGVTANVIHPGEVKTEMWQAIKNDAESRGREGEAFLSWAEMVESTGGDPPQKAADLIIEIIVGKYSHENGKFLWIQDGIQEPRETW